MAAADYFHPSPAGTPVHGPQTPYLGPPPRQGHARASSQQAGFPHLRGQYPSPHLSSPYGQPPPYSTTANMQAQDQKPTIPTSQPYLRRGSSQPQPYQPTVSFATPNSNPYTPPQPYPADPRNQQYFPAATPPQQPLNQSVAFQPQQSYNVPAQQQMMPYGRPGNSPAKESSASLASSHGGYSSDPEAHRHHHRRRRRRGSSDPRRDHTKDSLLGTAAGGLIGDIIFPGLGTVGGALAGFIGGREHGKYKDRVQEKREEEQRRWEKKWRKGSSEN